jgi:hypothetical protein
VPDILITLTILQNVMVMNLECNSWSYFGRYPHEQPDDPNDLCLDVHPTIIQIYFN